MHQQICLSGYLTLYFAAELCKIFELPIIKVASSDINTWPLLEKIASLKKPVIISTGGANEKGIDDCVQFFAHRNIPLAMAKY